MERPDPSRRALLLAALAPALVPASARAAAAPEPSTFAQGLDRPWGLAFLPDGRLLVTQKGGALVIVSADGRRVSAPLAGVPAVADSGQGGLLDVALDPDFDTTPWVYLSYAERDGLTSGTAVARGRLVGEALQGTTVIFRQQPKVFGSGHFGARLVFARDKTLFVTLGDRQKGEPAQDLASHLGKVVRLNRDGSVPADNPKLPGARPEIWSFGHRNPQGAALHPRTGELWLVEHGPQGGDELNIARAGGNHGWPLRSQGCPYGSLAGTACRIGGGVHAPAFVEPLATWVPTSIAPSGLAFYTAAMFPEWRGSLFVGALAGAALWRLTLDGERVTAREALYRTLGERIRDVRQGPDGALYLLTDNPKGRILRIAR
ncbi:PQQ-dependent sugar dehydrogenase [Piscinibacter defluvii]|uniref:PQQ-dependent sugar dehydrogenase n=1 Tax=Piscinibacter defluvii TaxID=1796922 RepID=UPI000FDE9A7F|nr:PQQ-dependent sugar dehydrogenase [Piscinibacter defluvii]